MNYIAVIPRLEIKVSEVGEEEAFQVDVDFEGGMVDAGAMAAAALASFCFKVQDKTNMPAVNFLDIIYESAKENMEKAEIEGRRV